MPDKELISVGEEKYLANGWKVIANDPHAQEKHVVLEEVDLHEAEHAVLGAEDVKNVTRVPGTEYRGLTEMSRFNPVAAVGPHAHGREGTGYDVSLLEELGYDVGSLARVARSELARKEKHVKAVARLLHRKETISGEEVRSEIGRAERGEEIIVYAISPDGEVHEHIEVTTEQVIKLPDNIIQFPQKDRDEQKAA